MTSSTGQSVCVDCDSHVPPNFDHVHWGDVPVPALQREDLRRVRGYAVTISGNGTLDPTWVFFKHREPALVFGRAGRMSGITISSYAVHPATYELRWDPQAGRDMHTLYLYLDQDSIDRQPDEHDDFQRWLAGVDASSSHFHPSR